MSNAPYLPQVRMEFPVLDRMTWQFGEKEDLTYKIIQDFQGKSVYAHRSIFTGTLLRNVAIKGGDFSRSDFDGARLEKCLFENISFYNVDLRSTYFSNVKFVDCDFGNSYINASYFNCCIFERCKFNSTSMTKCRYAKTTFENSDISMSTSLLNHYENCIFQEMSLGDCTFTLCFLLNCVYENVIFDISTLGSVYGLTSQDVIKFKYIFKGKVEHIEVNDDIIDNVINEFIGRHWYLGAAVMRLNYNKVSVIQALREIYLTITYFIMNDLLVNKDEITFLRKIIQELHSKASLPYYSLMDLVENLESILPKVLQDEKYLNIIEELMLLKNTVHILGIRMADEFARIEIGQECGQSDIVEIEVVFKKKPHIQLKQLVDELNQLSYGGNGQKVLTLHEGPGSWITCLQILVSTAVAFRFFLFMLNGCVIQLTELKARLRVLKDDSMAERYLDLAKVPEQKIPPVFKDSLDYMYKFTKNQNWLSDPDLKGYHSKNIEKITLR